MAPLTLYIATTNPGKLKEFARDAHAASLDVQLLPGIEHIRAPQETGNTFMANAVLKACAYSLAAPGFLVLADDSGLAVDALGGAPGVRSARFADDHNFEAHTGRRLDERNNDLLLQQMAHIGLLADRSATYVGALAVAKDGETLFCAEANCPGQILLTGRGSLGFGYDPLFYLPQLHRTMAQLSGDEKWQISHRGRAFRALLAQLQPG